jgi:pyridoxal phosphate enzyme (YggS family)
MTKDSIAENFKRVSDRLEVAATSVGRTGEQVRLVVVTKGHPVEIAHKAIEAGAKYLGENYVEESLPKIATVEKESGVEWHMIGHIQSRKARKVCEHFDWVQSIDSIRLATRLDRFASEMGKQLPILLECNVSGEETKYGWTAWNELEWNDLADEISPILEMSHLTLRGLMTIPPFFLNPEQARPYFVRLRKLRDYLAGKFPDNDWHELSMGMSADYEVAVQEDATIVRIGTAILGKRN